MRNIGRLVRPLVLVGYGVEEVYVYVDKEKQSTVMIIVLNKTFDWVEVVCLIWVCPVCLCTFYCPKVR